MKQIEVSLQKKLAHGTLLWIYANDKKVYRSSKRFDTASFSEHDSNFVGELEEVYANENEQHGLLYDMLEKSSRIYGVCLKKDGDITNIDEDSQGEIVRFFPTWAEMIAFANKHFTKADEEMERRETARLKWLNRGRLYVEKQNETEKEA